MKANELMIGDKIYRPDCYDTVKEIRETFIVGADNLRGRIDVDEIKPIPLTAEILEKNGWKHYPEDDERGLMEHCVLTDVGNAYFFSNGYIEFEIIGMRAKGRLRKELQFVHELQHALRLCGLNELADNFRI